MKTKLSRSYNQNELKIICDKLCDNIDNLLDVLHVNDLQENGKMLVGACPIHNGDNKSAFNLYPNGEDYRGNWKCRTHGCEKIFKGSIIGFIRGVLSNQKYGWQNIGDETVSFNDTIKFIKDFLQDKLDNLYVSKAEIEKKNFAHMVSNIIPNNTPIHSKKITRPMVRKNLEIPAIYFLNRGYSESILDKYDVGLCNNPEKEMYNRVVVPIYDNEYRYIIGCSGRSIFEKCDNCKSYHEEKEACPNDTYKWKYSKWKHNTDFKSQNCLYNFWFARSYILESMTAILVESPGNVWKLEEAGIHNSLCMFGSSLSDRQKIILDGSGAMNIIILTDNDPAGDKAAEMILHKCKNTYKVKRIQISKKDVGEMSLQEINEEIKPYL